jgi:hypothetical protein
LISLAAEIAQMAWLDRLFWWRSRRDSTQFHDFGGAIGKLPVVQSPDFIRLEVFADGRIELEGRLKRPEHLEVALKVMSVYRPTAIVFYSRENPEEDSQVGLEAVQCVLRVGLRIAFPQEATPTLNRILHEHRSTQ